MVQGVQYYNFCVPCTDHKYKCVCSSTKIQGGHKRLYLAQFFGEEIFTMLLISLLNLGICNGNITRGHNIVQILNCQICSDLES